MVSHVVRDLVTAVGGVVFGKFVGAGTALDPAVPVVSVEGLTGSRGALLDASGEVLTGGVSRSVLPADDDRGYLLLQNISDGDLWFNFGAAAAAGRPSLRLVAGQSFVMEGGYTCTEQLFLFGATTGQDYACKTTYAGLPVAVMSFAGADGSTTFTDLSGFDVTLTRVTGGSFPAIDTAAAASGTSSLRLQDEGRLLLSTAPLFGSNDFRLDFKYRDDGSPVGEFRTVFGANSDNTSTGLALYVNGGNMLMLMTIDDVSVVFLDINIGSISSVAFNRFTVIRQGSVITAYKDGVLTSTQSFPGVVFQPEPACLGGSAGVNTSAVGWVDEFSLSIAPGRYVYTP